MGLSTRFLDLDLRSLVAQARDPERLARDARRRPSQARAGRERQSEQDERPSLVRRCEVNRDEVQQRRNAEGDLEQGHVQGALDQAVGRRGQLGTDVRSPRVQEEGDDRGKCRVSLRDAEDCKYRDIYPRKRRRKKGASASPASGGRTGRWSDSQRCCAIGPTCPRCGSKSPC